MDPQQSSSTAAVDPDRVSIQYFEKGGANPQRDPVVVVKPIERVVLNSNFTFTFCRFPLKTMKPENVSHLVLKTKIIPLGIFYVTL